jgi:hypothetical protein
MVGSYVLGLMTWRDLDIHVVREDLDVRTFFDLGGEIAGLMKPHRMHFRDESTVGTRLCSIEAFAMFRDFGRTFARRRTSRKRPFDKKQLADQSSAGTSWCGPSAAS